MTDPVPVDVGPLDEPFPDLGHEAIRRVVLNALQQVWIEHQALVGRVAALESDSTDLTKRVAALEQAAPPPTTTQREPPWQPPR